MANAQPIPRHRKLRFDMLLPPLVSVAVCVCVFVCARCYCFDFNHFSFSISICQSDRIHAQPPFTFIVASDFFSTFYLPCTAFSFTLISVCVFVCVCRYFVRSCSIIRNNSVEHKFISPYALQLCLCAFWSFSLSLSFCSNKVSQHFPHNLAMILVCVWKFLHNHANFSGKENITIKAHEQKHHMSVMQIDFALSLSSPLDVVKHVQV